MSKKQRKKAADRPKKRKWLYINFGISIVLIIAGAAALILLSQDFDTGSGQAAAQPAVARPEQAAPDFSLPTLSGGQVSLGDYSGQVVMIKMWATWCPPCRAEMPEIDEFYRAHKDKGFVVLAINSQEEAPTVERFIQEQGFSFPVLLDTRGQVLNRYSVRGLPTSIIINEEGAIHYVHTGAITKKQMEIIIGPLLLQ